MFTTSCVLNDHMAQKFDKRLGSSGVELPVNPIKPISRGFEILRDLIIRRPRALLMNKTPELTSPLVRFIYYSIYVRKARFVVWITFIHGLQSHHAIPGNKNLNGLYGLPKDSLSPLIEFVKYLITTLAELRS